jgi:arylsulfatase A-like enzyme
MTTAGSVDQTPVISMDLTATMLDAAGVGLAKNERLDGESLRPLFQGGKLSHDALFFHYPHFAFHKANRPGSAIRSGQYKLILRYDDDSVELFDLENDLGETKNLATTKPDVTRQLKARLLNWLAETKAGLPEKRG